MICSRTAFNCPIILHNVQPRVRLGYLVDTYRLTMGFTNAITVSRTALAQNRWLQAYIIFFFSIWMSTLLGTSDINNWLLENTLVFLFLGFLILSYNTYQFSDLSYLLICVYLSLHVYGSKYTY